MIRAATRCVSALLAAAALTAAATGQTATGRYSFRLHESSLRAALDSVMAWYRVSVIYLDGDASGVTVTAACDACDLDDALDRVLSGHDLTWVRSGQQIVLMRRPVRVPPAVASVSGSVSDRLTGEVVGAANVSLTSIPSAGGGPVTRWCPVNQDGYYALRSIPPGSYTLEIRAVGYQPYRETVTLEPGQARVGDYTLEAVEIRLQEVMVEAQRTALLPAEGYARGSFLRAAPTDQNQYLLDGVRIYNPIHFGGVLATFNGDALNEVDVSRNGLPPSYGGRIGGILDLSMRSGTRHGLSGGAGTGSLGSHLALEGPLGPMTFLFSWRRGYPDPAVPFLESYGTPSPLGTTEVIGKLSARLSSSQQASASAYAGRDSYTSSTLEPGLELSNNFAWRNEAVTARWAGLVSPSLFMTASAAYTGYGIDLEHLLGGSDAGADAGRKATDFSIDDVSIRAQAEHFYDDRHTIRGGMDLAYRRSGGSIDEFSSLLAPMSLTDADTWELALYAQDQWAITPDVLAGLGLRATNYSGPGGSYSGIDPRFSLAVALSEASNLYISFSAITQYLHAYRNSGFFLMYPPIFWYPSTDRVKPSTALHGSLGAHTEVGDAYALSAEGFYRVTRNQHGFYLDPPGQRPPTLTDALRMGSGYNYGLEFGLRKQAGDIRGSISYTVAWAEERYDGIRGGERFASQFDRRHEVQGAVMWTLAGGWGISALCVLASDDNLEGDYRVAPAGPPFDLSSGGLAAPDVNGGRLPGFQRLEIECLRTFAVDRFICQASLKLVNAYGLVDPFELDLLNGPGGVTWRARLDDLGFFPLFPALSFSVRF
jgi:hypothetical protein